MPEAEYVVPWKFNHSHYIHENIYATTTAVNNVNIQNCGFKPANMGYCTAFSSSGACNRIDMGALKYMPQNFSVHQQDM